MPYGKSTIEVYRPGPICAECKDIINEAGVCEADASHSGTEMHDEGKLITVEVSARFSPIIPGRYTGPWEDCYPDEGGELEELTATVDGQPFDLTDAEEKEAIDACASDAFDPRNASYDGPDPSDYYDDRF